MSDPILHPAVWPAEVRRPFEQSDVECTVLSAVDMLALPAPAAVVEGLAWAGCLTLLAGDSGAGKTFVLLGLAAAVADHAPWLGRRTTAGSVLYISYESDALGRRLQALRAVQRLNHPEWIHFVRGLGALSPGTDRDGERPSAGERALTRQIAAWNEQLARDGRPPVQLVIVDTVRDSMTGSEDGSENVAAYLRAIRRIMRAAPGAACVLAHHTGWPQSRDGGRSAQRERGSSAFRGGCDATFLLQVSGSAEEGQVPLELWPLKIRDGACPPPLRLIRRRVKLADEDGGSNGTSCIIELDPRSPADLEADAERLAATVARELDQRILQAVRDASLTSIRAIRDEIGGKEPEVRAGVNRLLVRRCLRQGKRGEPYKLTKAGRAQLRDTTPDTPTTPGAGCSSTTPDTPLYKSGCRSKSTQSRKTKDPSRGVRVTALRAHSARNASVLSEESGL